MRLQTAVVLLFIAYLIWTIYVMDREQKAARKRQQEREVEWQLRRVARRNS